MLQNLFFCFPVFFKRVLDGNKAKAATPHLGRAFTDAQELRQASRTFWGGLVLNFEKRELEESKDNRNRLGAKNTFRTGICSRNIHKLKTFSQPSQPQAILGVRGWGSANIVSLVQEAGGTDFVRKTLASFLPDTVATCVLADLHCYDGFPALSAIEDNMPVFGENLPPNNTSIITMFLK